MPLSSKQILDAIEVQPGSPAVGRLAALRRFHANQPGDFYEQHLLDELRAVPSPKRDAAYDNPVGVVMAAPPGQAKALTAADVAWIQRLPSDPTQVTYRDARALNRLAAQVEPGSGDARLVNHVLEPIRRLHDGRAAEVELRNLQRYTSPALPSGPHGAAAVLAAAIRRETPALTEDEVTQRASQQLRDAVARRDAALAGRIEAARAKVAAISRPWNAGDVARSPHYAQLATIAARAGDHDAAAALGEIKTTMAELYEGTFGSGDAA